MNRELLQQVNKEKKYYFKKQFSKNPYYVLLRFYGADWWFSINELTRIENKLINNDVAGVENE